MHIIHAFLFLVVWHGIVCIALLEGMTQFFLTRLRAHLPLTQEREHYLKDKHSYVKLHVTRKSVSD